MKAMRVTDIHLIKQMHKAFKHEYTIAHVEMPESHRKYLGFEQLVNPGVCVDTLPTSQSDMALAGASRPNDASNIPQHQMPSTPSHEDRALLSSSTASLYSLCMQCPHNANNVIRALENPKVEQTDKILGRLKFRTDHPLYLYQLAILAVTLHESETGYKLFSKDAGEGVAGGL
jgi:hypothetical protein